MLQIHRQAHYVNGQAHAEVEDPKSEADVPPATAEDIQLDGEPISAEEEDTEEVEEEVETEAIMTPDSQEFAPTPESSEAVMTPDSESFMTQEDTEMMSGSFGHTSILVWGYILYNDTTPEKSRSYARQHCQLQNQPNWICQMSWHA